MAELALAGDVQAAKLVLAYAVGKPAAAPDPDRLDVEEWHYFKTTAPMMSEAENLLDSRALRAARVRARWPGGADAELQRDRGGGTESARAGIAVVTGHAGRRPTGQPGPWGLDLSRGL